VTVVQDETMVLDLAADQPTSHALLLKIRDLDLPTLKLGRPNGAELSSVAVQFQTRGTSFRLLGFMPNKARTGLMRRTRNSYRPSDKAKEPITTTVSLIKRWTSH